MSASLLTSLAHANPKLLPQGDEVVQLPGVGRIIGAFLLMLAIAVAVAALLRRFLPKLSRRYATEGDIQVIGRSSLAPGLRVYILVVDQQRVLLAENRSSLAITVLAPQPPVLAP
jgi:flagellar biogenesis protein FliO